MSTYPKEPGSPHTSPTTGAIAEELGWTPQSSLGMAHPTRSIRTSTLCFHHLTPSGPGEVCEAVGPCDEFFGGQRGHGVVLLGLSFLVRGLCDITM